jgi:hypothetical protein
MGLVASLSDFPASQILFLLAKFGKTGKVEINSEEDKGEVYFVKGKVTHSTYGDMTGVEALYNLSIFSKGKIEFIPDKKTTKVTIKDEVSDLISEIERRKVALTEARSKLPPFDTVLMKSPKPPADDVALRKDDWKILIMMDGKNSIKEVVEKSGMGALNIYKTIAWFLEKNLVYDPKGMERFLNQKIRFINTLSKELATLGIGEKEWLKLVENSFKESKEGKKLFDEILETNTELSLKGNKSVDISREELERLFSRATESIEERCKKEFGPMLTKTKFKAAITKVNEGNK